MRWRYTDILCGCGQGAFDTSLLSRCQKEAPRNVAASAHGKPTMSTHLQGIYENQVVDLWACNKKSMCPVRHRRDKHMEITTSSLELLLLTTPHMRPSRTEHHAGNTSVLSGSGPICANGAVGTSRSFRRHLSCAARGRTVSWKYAKFWVSQSSHCWLLIGKTPSTSPVGTDLNQCIQGFFFCSPTLLVFAPL